MTGLLIRVNQTKFLIVEELSVEVQLIKYQNACIFNTFLNVMHNEDMASIAHKA